MKNIYKDSGWIIRMCALCSTSAHEHYRPCVITAHCPIHKSATRHTTSPKMWSEYYRLWRIDASERGMTRILTVNNPKPDAYDKSSADTGEQRAIEEVFHSIGANIGSNGKTLLNEETIYSRREFLYRQGFIRETENQSSQSSRLSQRGSYPLYPSWWQSAIPSIGHRQTIGRELPREVQIATTDKTNCFLEGGSLPSVKKKIG